MIVRAVGAAPACGVSSVTMPSLGELISSEACGV
jgi:hypothetical protein